MVHAVQEGRPYADTTGIQHDIASLQSPYQDRPLALLPRWYDFSRLTGSSFNSPFYDRIQTPLIRQYNLGIQYEFLRNYVLEAAYVGSSGINIANYNHNVNPARLTTGANTAVNASARVPYLGFLPNGLQQNGFDAVYNYNSLQTTVRKTFSSGFYFQGAYTWSKNLSNVGYDAANLNLPTDMWQQYGPTPYSRPHRFILSYQYELPIPSTRVLEKLAEGWMVAGQTLFQSGNPLTLTDVRGGGAFGMPFSGSIENGVGRAQMCPGVTYDQISGPGNVKDKLGRTGVPATTVPRFFNPAVFSSCGPPAVGTDGSLGFGNSGVGIVRGPHQANYDFSITKKTMIGERHRVDFRAEFFNLFNHAQFALPAAIGGPQIQASSAVLFGVINGTSVNPRLIQFGLKYQF
jgi:hypothetical protein